MSDPIDVAIAKILTDFKDGKLPLGRSVVRIRELVEMLITDSISEE